MVDGSGQGAGPLAVGGGIKGCLLGQHQEVFKTLCTKTCMPRSHVVTRRVILWMEKMGGILQINIEDIVSKELLFGLQVLALKFLKVSRCCD